VGVAEGKMTKTFAGIAHPWLCDAMGHLASRHYLAMFDDASHLLLARLGLSLAEMKETRRGWADVQNTINYTAEVPLGSALEIFSTISRVGEKALTIESEMRAAGSERVHARMSSVVVFFDLDLRKASAISEEIRKRAQGLMSETVAT
jgi:acyl-CoA thioester hydrolase